MSVRIGITLDFQKEGTFSSREHYALRVHYFDAVHRAGGVPIAIPQIAEAIDDHLDIIDGLIIPGGGFASPESWYEKPVASMPYEPSQRLDYDMAIIEKALSRNMPLLGICAGMQLLAGFYGCKMTHNVHERYDTNIDHINGQPAEQYCHTITIIPDTLLARIYQNNLHPQVNSAHREAAVSAASPTIISAYAPDQVIEAIEVPKKRFALGVQWHPEFFDDEPVIPALINAATGETL